MTNCININSKEFKTLKKETGLSDAVLSTKISLWQKKNGFEKFPNQQDIFESMSLAQRIGISKKEVSSLQRNMALSKLRKYNLLSNITKIKAVFTQVGKADLYTWVISTLNSSDIKEQVIEQNKVTKLRQEEIEELQNKLLNAQDFITDNKIDVKKVKASDNKITKEIYNKYDKLISPLLNTDTKIDKNGQGLLFQESNTLKQSKASSALIAKLKENAVKLGINIQALSDYIKGNPDVSDKSINGLADTIKGVVAIAQGKEAQVLTEEYVHVATAIIEQVNPQLITSLISQIGKYKIYNRVLALYKNNKAYQLANGKPNIRKIKKEAVDKLIAEFVINENEGSIEFPELFELENRTAIQQMWDSITAFIRNLVNNKQVSFEETASKILQGNLGGDVSNLSSNDSVLYQISDEVQATVDLFKDMQNNTTFIDSTNAEERHYTYLSKEMKYTSSTFFGKKNLDRTPEEQVLDNIAKDYGTAGHEYIEKFIAVNLIDEKGLKLLEPNNIKIITTLETVYQKALEKFAINLIAPYPENTVFLVETYVADPTAKKGEGVASKLDFVAIYLSEDKQKNPIAKVDVLDWKFMSLNTKYYDDIQKDKKISWTKQMGLYTNMIQKMGVNRNQFGKTRMIPFLTKYNIVNDKYILTDLTVPQSDVKDEANVYMLPVPIKEEKTGNDSLDKLVASLKVFQSKLADAANYVPEEKYIQEAKIKQLSNAIRKLHIQQNFAPLYEIGKTFLLDNNNLIKKYENVDFNILSEKEQKDLLKNLVDFQISAQKFINIDNVYIDFLDKDKSKRTEQEIEILKGFRTISIRTEEMLEQAVKIQTEYANFLATEEKVKVGDFMQGEKALANMNKTFLEASKQSAPLIKLMVNMVINSRNRMYQRFAKKAELYSDIFILLNNEAKALGKTAFDMVATKSDKGLKLINQYNQEYYKKIRQAKEKKDKKTLLANLDIVKYNQLVDDYLQKRYITINNTNYTSDKEANLERREETKEFLKKSLKIDSADFNGYKNSTFSSFYKKAQLELEANFSSEYIAMSKSQNALKVWEFFRELNKKAYSLGFLDNQGLNFIPNVEASVINKLVNSKDIFEESKKAFKDLYTVTVDDENQYGGQIDEETGETKRVIRKRFINTDLNVNQLSTDLNRVGLLWMNALEEYENTKDLEFKALTILSVQKQVPIFQENARGEVLFENNDYINGSPLLKPSNENNENVKYFKTLVDDYIYGISETENSLGNDILNTVIGTDKNKQVSVKKVFGLMNDYIRAVALGLKLPLGVSNFVGGQFQNYINNSEYYKSSDFSVAKELFGKNSSELSLKEKAIINELVSLTGESVVEQKQRAIAKKMSYTDWLNSYTFSDVMMSFNSFGEKRLELANASAMINNSIVINGEIYNIRKYLKKQNQQAREQARLSKSTNLIELRDSLKASFEERVEELKKSPEALTNLADFKDGVLIISGVNDIALGRFRGQIVDVTRNMTGQMSNDDKMGFRRDAILSSFMMFKGWIPKLVSVRGKDITFNDAQDTWEIGRYRAFFSAFEGLGLHNVSRLFDIIKQNENGIKIITEMLQEKKEAYRRKTGKELIITQEEYEDMITQQISNMVKELQLILGILLTLILVKLAAPDDDDESEQSKVFYKQFAKQINKISNELLFFVNPLSADEMTKGSIIPALGILSKVGNVFARTFSEVQYIITENEEEQKKNKVLKYYINMTPIANPIFNDLVTYFFPDKAKDLGFKVVVDIKR